jgi:nucleoside-triphosphatase
MNQQKNILITGPPGCGKTTLIRDIAGRASYLQPAGFYTAEIRTGSVRKGFELVGFDGRKGLLAHVAIQGPHRVGKYGVDIPAFDAFLVGVSLPVYPPGLIIIDEIGKMECMSEKFRRMIIETLSSGVLCVATIALKGDRFIEGIKGRDDCGIIYMTRENREGLAGNIIDRIIALNGNDEPAS